jgi:hypothetical protein
VLVEDLAVGAALRILSKHAGGQKYQCGREGGQTHRGSLSVWSYEGVDGKAERCFVELPIFSFSSRRKECVTRLLLPA